jgi:hypothetical protein
VLPESADSFCIRGRCGVHQARARSIEISHSIQRCVPLPVPYLMSYIGQLGLEKIFELGCARAVHCHNHATVHLFNWAQPHTDVESIEDFSGPPFPLPCI